jgi:hypothetical protein
MNNQDMPANAQSTILYDEDCGETKREKAFWQVYSALIPHRNGVWEDDANEAMGFVNAGFKALESE